MMITRGFYSELKNFFPGWFGRVVKFFQVSRHLTHNINIVFRTLLLVLVNSLFSIPDKIDIHCTLLLWLIQEKHVSQIIEEKTPKKILPSLFQIQYICQWLHRRSCTSKSSQINPFARILYWSVFFHLWKWFRYEFWILAVWF